MKLIDYIPKMLADKDLQLALENKPPFLNPKTMSKVDRLIHTQDIFDIYIPNKMTFELYDSIYFLLIQACKRKEEGLNFHSMNNESLLVCGDAGIGKTEAISRINEIMFGNNIIELSKPYLKVIPILIVQATTISSFKGFLISILYAIDSKIGTNYSLHCSKNNINTDELLIATSKALNLHVLLLVCEEMNFLNESNKAMSFANQIVALSNIINTSIIFVCVPFGLRFFMSSDYLARRSLTKIYKTIDFEEAKQLILELLSYNYTLKRSDISQELIRLIYSSTCGNPALIKQVISSCQVFAISSGYEMIDTHSIRKGIENKLSIMEPYMNKHSAKRSEKALNQKSQIRVEKMINDELVCIFKKASQIAQKDTNIAIQFIEQFIDVEKVSL